MAAERAKPGVRRVGLDDGNREAVAPRRETIRIPLRLLASPTVGPVLDPDRAQRALKASRRQANKAARRQRRKNRRG